MTLNKTIAKEHYQKFKKQFDQHYTPLKNIWNGAVKGVPFTAFLKQISHSNNSGVLVIWEKI